MSYQQPSSPFGKTMTMSIQQQNSSPFGKTTTATIQPQQQPSSPLNLPSQDSLMATCTSVPENDVILTPPVTPHWSSTVAAQNQLLQQTQQQYGWYIDSTGRARKRSFWGSLLRCSCCCSKGGTRVVVEENDGQVKHSVVHDSSLPRSISITQDGTYCHIPSRKVSRKGSSLGSMGSRRWTAIKSRGSLAYSDADWFDAASTWSDEAVENQDAVMAEVDQLVKELGAGKGPWVPEPPLAFAVPDMKFIPLPERTGFAAYWLRDDERTTPPPQPIDVMTKASWIVQKSHNSIPGVLFEETDRNFVMTVKPRFLPPGLPRYQEYYDKANNAEQSWALRRDLRPGRSYGKIYLTTDNTLIFRVWTKTMFGTDYDLVMEEYMRLEDEGQVLVARQCCLDVKSGKRAVQYLVGRRHEVPPKGHV